jgi:hypothetical protein
MAVLADAWLFSFEPQRTHKAQRTAGKKVGRGLNNTVVIS